MADAAPAADAGRDRAQQVLDDGAARSSSAYLVSGLMQSLTACATRCTIAASC